MAGTPAKQKYTFTSYVNSPKAQNGCEDPKDVHNIKPKLLADELEVASAPVYMYPPTTKISDDNINEGIWGLLTVTNFKLSFVPYKHIEEQGSYQDNLFLGKNDVTLNNIDVIYQIVDKKKKKLISQQKICSRIEALHIVCKNFRMLKFSFKNTAKDQGKVIVSALARFAYPSRHDLSFGFCYKEHYYNTVKSTVTMFNSKNDWSRELIRCGTTEWRVLSAESLEEQSGGKHTFPMHFVIPKCCTVEKFLEFSRAFCDSRSAFWVYSYGNASLIRMGELKPDLQDTKIENVTLELVRKCDPDKKSLKILNLSERLPTIQDIQRAYLKFRQLCTPDSPRQFLFQDSKYLTLLEKSGWLFYVSLCLRYSCEAAQTMRKGTTVVLQENNGRDLCCIVSCLTQILLDPLYRTIDGFQSLIQKDWIALDHPFLDRLGHVVAAGSEEESPLLLLFLDCVWQLLQQYPEEFEYSQTYLTTIWDSAFLPVFDTFQFNSEYDRYQATRDLKLILRPVWDWNEQFAEKDKVFFTNPFYQKKQENLNRKSIAMPPNAILLPGLHKPGSRFTINPNLFVTQSTIPKDRYLEPRHGMSHLQVWEQCYYRWIPILEIKCGGFPQIDLYHRLLLSNIAKLQRAIDTGDFDDLPIEINKTNPVQNTTNNSGISSSSNSNNSETITVERRNDTNIVQTANTSSGGTVSLINYMPTISSFFPFSVNLGDTSQLNDILTNSNELIMEGSIMERLSIAQFPD